MSQTPAARGSRPRALWLRVHRWVALSVGWVLALVGLAGAVLVVALPVDRWGHPELFRADPEAPGTAARTRLEPIRQRLTAEFGPEAGFLFRPPRESDESLWVLVRGAWNGTVYLDPITGREQGRRAEDEGFVNVLFKLHSSLLLQDTGKAILACIALSYLALLITGAVLWWPRRWPPSWCVELRMGVTRGLFDLHRTGGAVMGLLIAVSVASGAYMAWRPLGEFVTYLSGGKSLKPPQLPKASAAAGPALALDALVEQAQGLFPNAPVGYVQVPARQNAPVRIRMRLADDPHPNGLTSVWLHPRTGAVLRVDRWNELDPGALAVSVVYPLHTGVLGGGWLQPIVFLNGSALGVLGFTGVWLWGRRRRRNAALRPAGDVTARWRSTPRR